MQPIRIPSQRYCPVCRGSGQNDISVTCPACAGRGHFNRAEFTSRVNAYDGLHEASFLPEFLKAAIDVSAADRGNIQLLAPSDQTLRIAVHQGFGKEFLEFFNVVKDGRHACGSAMNGRSRVTVSDVSTDPLFIGYESLPVMLRANARACQSTPLVSPSGSLLGVLSTHYSEPRDFTRDEFNHLDSVARHFTSKMEEHLRL